MHWTIMVNHKKDNYWYCLLQVLLHSMYMHLLSIQCLRYILNKCTITRERINYIARGIKINEICILINELRFIGPKLLLKIGSRLWQEFCENQYLFSGGLSILFDDLAQLPSVLYTSHYTTRTLWEQFKIIITLDKIFHQQGDNIEQTQFH